MKTIGIIGGMGPLATAYLYERIVKRTMAGKDQEHIHVIIDGNTNIPDRTEAILGLGEDPVKEMVKSAQSLEQIGADFLIMPCNTAHYFIDKIAENVNIKILNMVEETVKYTYENYDKNTVVGILATEGTIKSKIYDNYYSKIGINTVVPKKNQNSIMKFIYDVIKAGKFEEGTELFFETVNELKNLGADAFLLGCTELSSAQYIYKFKGNFINPMEVLTEKSIVYAGGQIN